MADTIIDRVQVEIDATAKGSSDALKNLENQLKNLKSMLNSFDLSKMQEIQKASRGISIDSRGMTKEERQILKSLDRIKQSYAGLNSYKEAAMSGDSSSLTTFSRKAIHLQSDIDILGEKLRQMQSTMKGGNVDTDMFQTYREQLSVMQGKLNGMQAAVHRSSDSFVSLKERAADAGKRIASAIGTGTVNIVKRLGSAIKNAAKNMFSLSNSSRGFHGNFKRGFMTILKYGFGIRSLYVLFRRLRKAIVESFGELQKSGAFWETTKANVEALKNSLTLLKYQFGAAFEPIFNAIAPALQTLINYLVAAANALSAFFAKLTGKSTYSKAVINANNLADATGGAARAQKELNKQLQGFDELNNLTSNNPSGGGGGGGAAGDASQVTYVEESVDSVLGDFGKTLIEKIKQGDWEGLGEVIGQKLTDAMNKIPWNDIYEKARGFGKGLAEFLNGLISPELFGALGQTIGGAINTALNFLNSFGETFEWSEFGLSIATGINKWFETTDFALAGDTVHTWIAGILDAGIALLENTDFEQIGEKIADFLNGLQIADIAAKLLTFGKTLIGAIASCIEGLWNNADAQTKIGLALAGLFAVANFTGLSAKLGTALTSYLAANPLTLGKVALAVAEFTVVFEGAKWVFGNIAEDFDEELASYYENFSWSEFVETIMSPDGSGIDWATIKEAWCDMMEDYFTPLFDEVAGWISIGQDIVNNIKTGITNAVTGIKDWVTEHLVNPIKTAINFGKEFVINIGAKVSEKFQSIMDTIKSWRDKGAEIATSIKGNVTEKIDKIKEKLKNLKDKFKKIDLKASLSDGVSKVVSNIKNAVSKISGKTLSMTANLKGGLLKGLEKVKSIWDAVKGKALSISATFNDSFSAFIKKAWNGVANGINKAVDTINKIPGVSINRVPTFTAKGAYANKPTNVIFGEAGAEAILPLERNLGAINKIAGVMLDGMANVSKYKYNPQMPTSAPINSGISSSNYDYSGSENRNYDAIMEQNRLLAEQNRLLQQIANKDVTISSRDVFNATRSEAQNYNNRTGNSPFVF